LTKTKHDTRAVGLGALILSVPLVNQKLSCYEIADIVTYTRGSFQQSRIVSAVQSESLVPCQNLDGQNLDSQHLDSQCRELTVVEIP
jgi:hypothetical protein